MRRFLFRDNRVIVLILFCVISTKETFLYLDGKPDRWVRTGDEVMFNELGEIFVVDRIKVNLALQSQCLRFLD